MRLIEISWLVSQAAAFGLLATDPGSEFDQRQVRLSSNGSLGMDGEIDIDCELDDTDLYINGQSASVVYGRINNTAGGSPAWGRQGDSLTFGGMSTWGVCVDVDDQIVFIGYGNPSDCPNAVKVNLHINEAAQRGTGSTSSASSAATTQTSSAESTDFASATAGASLLSSLSSQATTTSTSTDVPLVNFTDTQQGTGPVIGHSNGAAKKSLANTIWFAMVLLI